jgi:hypothetical protein
MTVECRRIDLVHVRESIRGVRRIRPLGKILPEHALALLLTATEKAPAVMTMIIAHVAPPEVKPGMFSVADRAP